ncbi:MAG: SemiSWEET transporter [Saprospiraceae bacterium]|nr:SemiSWEET transporter [Saprospiraceae bacterium]
MDSTTIIGLVSAALTTGAYVPQAVKTWRTRRTSDLSLSMFMMVFLGTAGWLVYGLLKDDLPIILANIITLGTSFVILYYKVLEVRQGEKRLIFIEK